MNKTKIKLSTYVRNSMFLKLIIYPLKLIGLGFQNRTLAPRRGNITSCEALREEQNFLQVSLPIQFIKVLYKAAIFWREQIGAKETKASGPDGSSTQAYLLEQGQSITRLLVTAIWGCEMAPTWRGSKKAASLSVIRASLSEERSFGKKCRISEPQWDPTPLTKCRRRSYLRTCPLFWYGSVEEKTRFSDISYFVQSTKKISSFSFVNEYLSKVSEYFKAYKYISQYHLKIYNLARKLTSF